jgi:hypothetical protein
MREWEVVENEENGVVAGGSICGGQARRTTFGGALKHAVARGGRAVLEYVDGMYS